MHGKAWCSVEEHFNPASRLHRIFSAAKQQRPDINSYDAWARVFGINERVDTVRRYRVAHLLAVVRDEIGRLEHAITRKGLSSPRYPAMIQSLHAGSDLGHLNNQWTNLGQHITDGVLNPLELLIEILPSDGQSITPEEVADILEQLDALRTQAITSTLPQDVKDYLIDYINTLINVLREYPISGREAFINGLGQAVAGRMRHAAAYAQTEESDEGRAILANATNILGWLMRRASEVDTMYGVFEVARKLLGG